MKRSIRLIPVLALFIIGATAWSIVLADPDKNDITVIGIGWAPKCDFQEGEVRISNSSSVYYYRVQVTAKAQNHPPGPAYCCEYPCECDLSGTWNILREADRQLGKACLYDVPCAGCENICDNTDCPTGPDFCTCVYGSYLVTHYSTNGVQYLPMSPSYPTPITVKEQADHCPDLGPQCS